MNRLTINGRGESGQDNFAFEFCDRKANGTFLDIGCAEPIRWNNTFALEQVGWRGWLIDITGEFTDMIRAVRKSPFYQVDATCIHWRQFFYGQSQYTLKTAMESIPTIDYLSLDVDESPARDRAYTILANLIDAGISFRCATIEHDAYKNGDQPRAAIRELMRSAGYRLAHPERRDPQR